MRVGGTTWLDTAAGITLPPHRRMAGFVFQDYALFPHLTALGNVLTALGHRPHAERRRRAIELLASSTSTIGPIVDRRRCLAASVSASPWPGRWRAIPQVLLLDEPFAAVDRTLRRTPPGRDRSDPTVAGDPARAGDARLRGCDSAGNGRRRAGQGSRRGDRAALRHGQSPRHALAAGDRGTGQRLEATVVRLDADRGLAELSFDGGRCLQGAITSSPAPTYG